MKHFNVVSNFTHCFDVIVPNFSILDSMMVEIDYQQYKIIDNLSVLLDTKETNIFVGNVIEEEITEILNLPVEFKSALTIDAENIPKYIYSTEVFKDVTIRLKNKCASTFASKEFLFTNPIKFKTTIEATPMVAELVKLYEIDNLTWVDLDGKALENIYYKTTP